MPTRPGPHVLIVEDDSAAAHFIRAVVLRLAQRSTASLVHDGLDAIRYFQGEGPFADRDIHPLPDLVILDLGLPGLHGLEVLAWLDQNKPSRETPVVVFSGVADTESTRQAFELGARTVLHKSGDPVRLAIAVGEALARWTSAAREGTNG